jgi:hypothetical protein
MTAITGWRASGGAEAKQSGPTAPAVERAPETPNASLGDGMFGGRHFIPESAEVKELPVADPTLRAVHIVRAVDDTAPRNTGPAQRPDYQVATAPRVAGARDAPFPWRVIL